MRQKLLTEYYSIIGTAIVTHLIWRSILGDLIYNGRPLEIQDHDNFFILPKLLLVILTFVILLSVMYLFRWVHAREVKKSTTLFIVTLTTVAVVVLFVTWLISLRTIDIPWTSLYQEVNGADRVQMDRLAHALLTFCLGVVGLFDITMGYKLLPKNS